MVGFTGSEESTEVVSILFKYYTASKGHLLSLSLWVKVWILQHWVRHARRKRRRPFLNTENSCYTGGTS